MRQKGKPNTAHVYGLIDPATHTVKYVGQTRALTERLAEHRRGACASTRKWIATLQTPPVLVVLETVTASGSELYKRVVACETKWLKRFRCTVINRALRDNCPAVWDALVNH